MKKPLNIVVMLGGPSVEREVSLRSGAAVAKALRSLSHNVTELDPKNSTFNLPPQTDAVFLALHGSYGEDGTVQSQLDKLGVPYTGCDAESSRIAFDKVLTKQRCLDHKVPTAKFAIIRSPKDAWPAHLAPPCVLKPVHQGSSVGLHFLDRADQLSSAATAALQYDHELLLEERVIGRETTVGILKDAALPIVEVRPKAGSYDYTNKYTAGATDYLCPAPFEAEISRQIQDAGLAAFRAVGARDYGRVDVMVSSQGAPIVLEVNTLPGMTETSLLPKAAAAAGLSYPDLCQTMIDLALTRTGATSSASRVALEGVP
jgi:D-alanine-D-alanine ligase